MKQEKSILCVEIFYKQLKITIMKKIFTLLFSVAAFATSFAQSGSHQHSKDKTVITSQRSDQYVTTKSDVRSGKFDNHRENIYSFSARERDQQIEKINYQFNYKVKSIQGSRNISSRQKKMMIQDAKWERNKKIQDVNSKFENKYNTAYKNHEKKNVFNRH